MTIFIILGAGLFISLVVYGIVRGGAQRGVISEAIDRMQEAKDLRGDK